jgi:hypothetical protein
MRTSSHLWRGIARFTIVIIGLAALGNGCTSPGDRQASDPGSRSTTKPTSNVSFGSEPVKLQLSTPYIVSIDPLALDGLRDRLQLLEGRTPTEQRQLLKTLSVPLRIGLHEVKDFRPGLYSVSRNDFEAIEGSEADERVVDVDSGTIVLADLAHLARVARVLTWERYDRALQAQPGDDSAFRTMERELGGPFFAIVTGSVDSSFQGDGAYRLRSASPRIIE